MKKVFAVALAAVLLCGALPLAASAKTAFTSDMRTSAHCL